MKASSLAGLAVATLIYVSIGHAVAAEFPDSYRGIWTSSDSCEQTISKWSEGPGAFPFMVVTKDETIHHESSCKLTSVEQLADKDAMNFKCSGEGYEWELTQNWSIRDEAKEIDGGMLFDRMTIKTPTLVVSDPEGDLVYRRCGAVCVKGKCWGA